MRDLKGRLALITGGGGGLGLAVASRLAREGMRLALWDLDHARLAHAQKALKAQGAEARGYALDVSDPSQVRSIAQRVLAEMGPVDLLDNNAGVAFPGEFLEQSEEESLRTVEVNLNSFLWCTRAFLPGMVERGRGHLVMTASAAGLLGVPGMAVYSASKHAVVGFAESLRLELKGRGLRGIGVTIVCPSFVATGMFEGATPPLGTRWLSPEALAETIVAAVRAGRLYVREPALVKLIPLLKALPGALWTDWAGELSGMNRSLAGFAGKKGGTG